MINYKKGALSVFAAMAISSLTVSADYLPLTDGTNQIDNIWTLFGVSGFKTDGSSAGTKAGEFSIANNTSNTVVDSTQDDLFVEGFIQAGKKLGKVKVLPPYTSVQVRIDTTGVVYEQTDPERTVYVAVQDGGAPAFAITYKSVLEGKRVEYSIATDGSDAHFFILNSANTFRYPVVGQVIGDSSAADGSGLSKIVDAVDYNLENNPDSSAYYVKSEHYDKDLTKQQDIRMYSYDAASQTWLLFDSNDNQNDFDALEKGKAYWAKIDTDGTKKTAGLVLGKDAITTQNYTDNGIAEGWNLLAFNSSNPDIRIASTGLIVSDVNSSVGKFKLVDASTNHELTIDIAGTDLNVSQLFNTAIRAAKKAGEIPKTLDVKAFPTSIANTIAFISNKRFTLKENNSTANALGETRTLAGKYGFNPDTNKRYGAIATDTTDLDDNVSVTGVQSAYGEYMLVMDPLVGAGTAQSLGQSKLHIKSLDPSGNGTDALFDLNLTVAATATQISLKSDLNAKAIDIKYDDANSSMLIASTQPFFIRDNTFTRVFKYTDTDKNGTITVSGLVGVSTNVDINDTNATGTDAAAEINRLVTDCNATAIKSKPSDTVNNTIVVIASKDLTQEFDVTEDVNTSHIEDSSTADKIAKGAIQGVYSLNYLAKRDIVTKITLDIDAVNDDANDSVSFGFNGDTSGDVDSNITGTTQVYDQNDSTSVLSYMDKLVATLQALATKKYLNLAIDHNYTTATDDLNSSVITLEGTDLVSVRLFAVENDAGPDDNVTDVNGTIVGQKLEGLAPDVTIDLKYNGIYTPNYVIDGPLYDLKKAGFTAQAMVTGTMDYSNLTVGWDSVDLSQKPSLWLDGQDYNLFTVDASSGYWTYLAPDSGSNALAVTSINLTPQYVSHLNNPADPTKQGTSYNHVSGGLVVEIDGLDSYDDKVSVRVNAYLAGSNIELTRGGGDSNVFTGKISSYELKEMSEGSIYSMLLNISDGLGYNLKGYDPSIAIDFKKPDALTIDISDATSAVFTSTSDDVAGVYIFDGNITEQDTENAANKLAWLPYSEASTGYALCSGVDKLDFNDSAYIISVFGVDNEGKIGNGNASDITQKLYVPMLKSSILLEDTNSGEITGATVGTLYNASCATDANQTAVGYGMQLTSMSDLKVVKMTYESKDAGTATPTTVFVKNNISGAIARITYEPIYEGQIVYVDVDGRAYQLKLPTAEQLETAGNGKTESDPLVLDTNSNFAKYFAGQSL